MSRSELNPAFLVFAADELADASSMTFEQFGMFARLRALAWREHGISSNHYGVFKPTIEERKQDFPRVAK